MAKKLKSRRTSRKTFIFIFTLSLLLALIYLALRRLTIPTAQPNQVFILESNKIEYGKVSVSGVIRKTPTSSNKESGYVIVTDTNLAIKLDVNGIDPLVNSRVVVSGLYLPLDAKSGETDFIKVNTITLEE